MHKYINVINDHFISGNAIHPKWLIEEQAISIFKEVSLSCLRVPTIREIIHIIDINGFIANLLRKDRGISFCQVNKIIIINHEMNLDILTSQKCKGAIAIFRASKIVRIKLLFPAFSSIITFLSKVHENK